MYIFLVTGLVQFNHEYVLLVITTPGVYYIYERPYSMTKLASNHVARFVIHNLFCYDYLTDSMERS